MTAEIQTLRAQFAAELAKRDELIEGLQAQIEALQARLSPPRTPKSRLPDPDKFDGQQIHWDTWLPAIEAKLLVDGDVIRNDIAKFYYVYG